MGRIKGSAGNMTGCKVYDKNVMRAKAFEVTNPNTPAQQTQRAFFAELTAVCTDFSDELLRTLFPQKPKSMSRRNAITKQIGANYEVNGTTKSIDYSTIDTLGNAPVMDFGITTCAVVNDAFRVTLDASVSTNQQLGDYYFFVAMINETKGEISITPSSAKVSTGYVEPSIPATWSLADTCHAIAFITGSKVPLVGFGTMGVTKRPARQG